MDKTRASEARAAGSIPAGDTRSMKPKVLVILGPTASGKSALAVKLAKKFNGEIISADSRQVYRGLDIGSGKITAAEMKGVAHHLLDVADPKQQFSVARYQKLANQKIKEILKRDKLPIICGGTGFYIQAIVDGTIFPEVAPNKKLRTELVKKSPAELFKILEELDSDRAKSIDAKNPHRLIRAIEIATALGKTPKLATTNSPYDFIQIGLNPEPEILKKKIKLRLAKRLKQGLIEEVKNLHEKDKISWARLESFGLEYKFAALYLQGKLSKKEMVEKLNTEIWHYAKRQLTWFKRDKRIHWIKNETQAKMALTGL